MATDDDNRSADRNKAPQADRWTRESFILRRMTWSNIWLLLAAFVVLAFAVATWMTT